MVRGEALKADADRDGQDLAYVDQVGTFMNLGRNLKPSCHRVGVRRTPASVW